MTQEEAAQRFIDIYNNSKFVKLLEKQQKMELLKEVETAPTVVILEAINYIKAKDKEFADVEIPEKAIKKESDGIYALVNTIETLTDKLRKKYNIA